MLYVTISSLDLVLQISYHVIWYNNVSCQIQYQIVLITYKSKSQHTIILYHMMKTDSVLYIIWYNTGLYLIKSYNHPCSQIKTQLKWTKEADRKNHPWTCLITLYWIYELISDSVTLLPVTTATTRFPTTSGILLFKMAAKAAQPEGSATNPISKSLDIHFRISLSDTKMTSSTYLRQHW